jgi:hypothetical protein
MKRKILVIAVIALVAVAVFGSQALADKPGTLPSNPDISDVLQSMNQTLTNTQGAVGTIDGTVNTINGTVETIFGMLDDPNHGLVEIKAEVANIEATVNSMNQTLTNTQGAVAAIEVKVNEMDAKLDGMVKMESYSGKAWLAAGNSTIPVHETYPEARHVSLTLSVFPMFFDDDDFVYVLDKSVSSFIGAPVLTIGEGGPFYATVEFVTTEWSIWAGNGETGGGPWPVDYKYTVTYPD